MLTKKQIKEKAKTLCADLINADARSGYVYESDNKIENDEIIAEMKKIAEKLRGGKI